MMTDFLLSVIAIAAVGIWYSLYKISKQVYAYWRQSEAGQRCISEMAEDLEGEADIYPWEKELLSHRKNKSKT